MPDPGLEATRAIREKISREHGNDAKRLVEYSIEHQRRFADRLRWAPGTGPEADESTEDAVVTDAGTQRR
jgi:hypothetical protein